MEKRKKKSVMFRLAAFFILSLLTFYILDSGQFLRVFVLTERGFSCSFETAAWLSVLTLLYCYAFSDWENRRIVCSAVCGVLMSLMVLLGIRYSLNEKITLSLLRSVCALAAGTCVFTGLVSALFRGCARISCCCHSSESRGALVRSGVLVFAATILVYLPVFLAVYPGIYSYDASIQVMQMFGVHPLTTHHPLLHSLYLFCCFRAGELLFHSYQAGMAMYALSQAVFMAAVFSVLLCRMEQRGAPWQLRFLSWAFLVINPYVTVFSFVTTKDVLFGAFFALLFDLSFDLLEDPEAFLKKKSGCVAFFGAVLLMCLFRNQGIYVYLLFAAAAICFFWCRKQERKQVLCRFVTGSLVVCLGWYVLFGPLPSAFGIEKGDSREMLCVPMQQLARVWTEEPELLSEEEKAYIETLITPQALKEYVRVNADPVKSGFRTEVLRQDPKKFLSVWASLGVKDPELYFDSFCMGNWGYWYPGESQYWIDYILFDGAFLEPEYNILNVHRNSHFPKLEQTLRELTLTPAFDSVPVLSFVLNQAFPFWLMLTAALFAIWKRRLACLIPLFLILGYWGTLLLGPVTSLRYVLPLIYCVPRMAEIFLFGQRE